MRVIVTCGPSWEPVDEMRRLTNASTGELGLLLAAKMVREGFEVLCMKGEGAVSRVDTAGAEVVAFSTNDDLLRKLALRARWADAVFHAAALCDFRVRVDAGGARKIPTAAGDVTLTLEPAPKVLPRLREFFPSARIVGWKYELDGGRADVLARAARQMELSGTHACVVNGAAWGPGFGLVVPGRETLEAPDREGICRLLVQWAKEG